MRKGGEGMELDIREALRYLGIRGEPDAALRSQMTQVAARLTGEITPRYTYRVFDLERVAGGFALAGTPTVLPGATAERMLSGSHKAALLGCTLGARFDRLLLEAQARDMARAVMLDACGGAFVEAGCDAAQEEIAERFPGEYLTDRFSPGYGDLPLALQGELCALLDAPKRLGLHVTGSYMLNPVKSVTAVIGIAQTPQPARVRGCDFCTMRKTCAIAKEGRHCGA